MGNEGPESPVYTITIDLDAPDAPSIGGVTDNVGDAPEIIGNGGATNDPQPVISGTAEPGALITIYDNGTEIGTATADATTGAWSFTPPALGDGNHILTTTATDAAGNLGVESEPYEIIVDLAAPDTPGLTEVLDGADPVTGAIANGGSTNDTTPIFNGTAQPGALITIYNEGVEIATIDADPVTGAWTYAPTLGEGDYAYSFTATDAAGNESAPTTPFEFTVDTTPPAAPTVGLSDGFTVTGTGEPGVTIQLDIDGDGEFDESAVVDVLGNWSIALDPRLPEGVEVTAVAVDAAGLTSLEATGTVDYSIDSTPPAAPTIDGALDDADPVIGAIVNGGSTNDTTPTLSGSGAELGATISIYRDGALVDQVPVGAGGDWEYTPGTALPEGTYSFIVTATDTDGNESAASPAFTLTVDVTPPADPTVDPSSGGELTGTAEPGVTVNIDLDGDGTSDDSVLADAAGNWIYTPADPIPGGMTISVSATDAAGNMSGWVPETIDAAAPAAPTIDAVLDDVGDAATILAGGATNDPQPTVTGTAEAGALITIYDNGAEIGTTTADATTGTWSFTPTTDLEEGPHSFTAVATDAAGNEGAASDGYAITVDITPPPAPTFAPTNGLLLSGTAEANADIEIDVDGDGEPEYFATANVDGEWNIVLPTQVPDGTTIAVRAVDGAGNVSAPATRPVDGSPPAAPILLNVTDDTDPVTGLIANNGATNDTQPTISGTAEAGSTVIIYGNGGPLGTVVADAVTGAWTFTPPEALTDGTYTFTARASDAAQNVGPASTAYTVTIDTGVPAAPAITGVVDDVQQNIGTIADGGLTNDSIPVISGTSEPSLRISIYDNGTLIGTTVADTAGIWTFAPTTPLGEGDHNFTVIATDGAGNASPASDGYAITVDLTPPPAPAITGVTDDALPITGSVGSGGVTNDTTPTISGTGAQPNGRVVILNNGTAIGTATADAAGVWAFTPSTPLPGGAYSFTAAAVDAAGNQSAPSAPYGVTIDTAAPTATISITGLSIDTGVVGDWRTQDTSPAISGNLSAGLATGERVEVSVDGGAWTNATVVGTSWFYGPGALSIGAHNVTVRVVDAAGNIGNSASQGITIDPTPNQPPLVQVSQTALLGLAGADALGLIDLSGQSLTAFDPNGNLRSVQISYSPLINLGAFSFAGSQALAAELGLRLVIDNNPGLLGLLLPSATVTITSLTPNAPMSNLAVNELLRSIHFIESGISLRVLDATTITATDTNGASSTAAVGTLANLSLLAPNGDASIIEGNGVGNRLTGTAGSDRLYGYGGDDVLIGGAGNDLLRGGAGSDRLEGGAGNDLLVYDAADSLIDGGTGFDTLLVEAIGPGIELTLNASTNVRNIERIDLGTGDSGRQIVLTAEGVVQATDSNRQLFVTGDANDSVTMTGAVHQGQTMVNGTVYDNYTLGTTTVFVEDPVMVVV